ncbi:MAG: hypothetical protein PHQ43_00155 [Dehalococcoidales bacterium]|nr:hypothetical protein [Dehalococcoidales bacterium]
MMGRGAGGSIGKWARYISANDTNAALTVNQRGLGDILALQGDGVTVCSISKTGAITPASVVMGDDKFITFGGVASLGFETKDANANAVILALPNGGATDVPVFAIGDQTILDKDLGFFNAITEPTFAVLSDAATAYVSLDAVSKGLNFKPAADGDVRIITIDVTGTPHIDWDNSEQRIVFSHPIEATSIIIRTAEDTLYLTESDQTDPAGQWRWDANGNAVYFQHALTAAWGTNENWYTFDKPNELITFGKNVALSTGLAIQTGKTAADTVLFQAYDNDTGPGFITFGTLTAGNTPSFTLANITMEGTWLASGTVTMPALTLGGAIAGGDQSFTNVGDMTFAAGSILASGGTNGNTLLMKANDTTFITFTTAATDVCELDACTLDSSIAKGTWTASGTWTIPAVTLGGAITGASQNITGVGTFGAGAATVTGLTITSEMIQTAGAWAFQKAYTISSTAALTLQANGQSVMVGAASCPTPDSLLHVWNATAGTVAPLAGTVATFENSADIYLSILGPNANTKGILFGEPASNARGGILYDGSAVATPDVMKFYIAGANRLSHSAGAFAFQEATILSSTAVNGIVVDHPALTNTAAANLARFAVNSTNAITLNTGTVPVLASLLLSEPNITIGTGAATIAATLAITGAPTEGGTNLAAYIASGGLGLGVSATPQTLTYNGNKALAIYTTCGSTDGSTSYEPILINNILTGAGQVGGRVKVNMSTDVALGSYANAFKAQVECNTNGRASGLLSAGCFELVLPASDVSGLGGNYAPVESELNCPASHVSSPYTAFMFMSTGGDATAITAWNAVGALFTINGLTAATSATNVFHTTGSVSATHGLRVRIDGVDYDILLKVSTYA